MFNFYYQMTLKLLLNRVYGVNTAKSVPLYLRRNCLLNVT